MIKTVLVAGAGIVGMSTAIWLQRYGYRVTLVDQAGPASGTSYGNAGVLAAGSVIPVTTPGLLTKAPGMLLRSSQPLFMRPSYLPKLVPFLSKYLAHANRAHVERYAAAMSHLLYDTVEQHRDLAAGTAAAQYINDEDYLFGYDSRAAYEKDQFAWDIRRKNGHEFEVLEGSDLDAVDSFYRHRFPVVVVNKNHGKINDPGAYIRALCKVFQSEGGLLHIGKIQDLIKTNGRITGLLTDKATMSADHVVFTLGPWSGEIAKKLGLRIPFESERGYHIELVNPSHMPTAPMMVASGKFVVTPMIGRIRLAGVVEFGGLSAGARKAPLNLLKKNALSLFPDVSFDRIDEWLGHRPTTANSLPLIGALRAFENVFVGFGHQHVGLTGGAKTGRMIAQMIDGQTPNMDLSEFDPNVYAH